MTAHPTEPHQSGASRGDGALPRGPRRSFGARLHAAIADRGPLCVGIDPHAALLHEWGLADDVAGLERFALTTVEAVAPHAAVVKPQSAFYERFGSRGIAVLERVIAESRAAGALVLLDVKRGDIGSTSQAYADAYLDPTSPLASDAITVSPFLGFGSLDPLVDTARRHDAGLFVLALTSNKEGPEVQHARVDEGGTVAGTMLDHLRRLNADATPLGSFGAVVGATIGDTDEDLAFNGPVLAPGFGAQGGTLADVRRLFGSAAAVLPSSSREVLRLGPSVDAMRDFVLRTNEDLRA
jgi:orotidine-5'-phosphate decarboxylase